MTETSPKYVSATFRYYFYNSFIISLFAGCYGEGLKEQEASELKSSVPGYGSMAGSYVLGNEPSGSTKSSTFLD
jgi:hypothetical protein